MYLATVWATPVIIAITFHEAAHGFVAHLLGDDCGSDVSVLIRRSTLTPQDDLIAGHPVVAARSLPLRLR
jgi:hypothetical protein